MLDIFHALEHVSAASQALHTEPTDAAEWTDAAREALLQDGWRGIQAHLRVRKASLTPCQQAAVAELRNYLGPHEHHLNYRQRLAAGRSIGSGQVEGACKNMIGHRLKQTGARWRCRRVNRMAGLCSLMYSHQWQTYWEQAA